MLRLFVAFGDMSLSPLLSHGRRFVPGGLLLYARMNFCSGYVRRFICLVCVMLVCGVEMCLSGIFGILNLRLGLVYKDK